MAACKERDDCQKLLDRSPGEEQTRGDKQRTTTWLVHCRENLAEIRQSPLAACLIAADSDEKAVKCIDAAADEAEEAKTKAEEIAARAAKDAKEGKEVVERLQKDVEVIAKRVDEAVDGLTGAQSQADRDAAKARLDQLRREQAELDARLAEAKSKAARAERLKGVKISKECLDNPLAKGCN
jgi:hypothetical protein